MDNLPQKKRRRRLTTKQKKLLQELPKHNGNVTAACKAAKVSRELHYLSLKGNDYYRELVDMVWEAMLDRAEEKLIENVESGDQRAIEFLLKAKAKKRGYGDSLHVESNITQRTFSIEAVFRED